uniref:Uncharacterized protein n=1 Tax=Arundo donax TaxID=35708 RepID=A0A0A8ZUT9_ARUDO
MLMVYLFFKCFSSGLHICYISFCMFYE